MDEHATALADAIDEGFVPWFVGAVRARAEQAGAWSASLEEQAQAVAEEAHTGVMADLRALLAADIDDQRTTPLSILRAAVPAATAVLAAAGVAPVERDPHQRDRFPDDAYDLTPAAFADLGDRVGQAGITWGAAKAFAHKQRHGGSA